MIGRPSLYRAEYHPEKAEKLALLMATDAEIADFFGITRETLYAWKAEFPAFSDAIKRGGIQADAEVASKLKWRALGYSHEAVKIFMPAGAKEPIHAPYVEHYPPDTNAASLWLRNRQRGRWRDQQDHEHRHVVDAATMPYEELLALAQAAPLTIEHEAHSENEMTPPKCATCGKAEWGHTCAKATITVRAGRIPRRSKPKPKPKRNAVTVPPAPEPSITPTVTRSAAAERQWRYRQRQRQRKREANGK